MKKQIMTLLTASLLLGTSCSNDFLEEKMVSVITTDYFDTETGLEQLVVGSYNALRWKYGWTEGTYTFEMGTDIGAVGNQNWCTFSSTVWSPSGAAGTQAYNLMGQYAKQLLGAYPVISDINRGIESIRGGKAQGKFASDADYANLRLSELLFNRAWEYYMLNTVLGDIYVTQQSSQGIPPTFEFKKWTSEQLYKLLIGDLRFCYEHLEATSDRGRGGLNKYAAAHFLSKLYLQRAQGAEFGQYRSADGTIDNSNPHAYLGMLYKGSVSTDLDSAEFFATQVIEGPYQLEPDYWGLFRSAINDYSNQDSKEIILQASYGNGTDNGRFGMRMQGYFTASYVNALWGIPSNTWYYGSTNTGFKPNDWAYDVFTNKIADSRFEKSFRIEYEATANITDKSNPVENSPYLAYNHKDNASVTWTQKDADYFNEHILPTYDRPSWGGRQAVKGEHKIGTTDLGLVFLENTKETAIDIDECTAQPYMLRARWVKDGNKYYYRPEPTSGDNALNVNTFLGLENGFATVAASKKHIDPNRGGLTSEYGTRDVAMFRLAETYLIRAEVKGRKGDFAGAISDINMVRRRAAYKPGEERAEVLARLYPGSENLTPSERQYPYTVEKDMTRTMEIDATYWDGSSAASQAENYPEQANTDLKRFIHFIYNELAREMNSELTYYEGIHHAGIQAERILWHNQMGSTLKNHWPVSDNVSQGKGQDGNGKGTFDPNIHTFRPFPQSYIDQLTDENGKLLDAEAKAKYQNPGY